MGTGRLKHARPPNRGRQSQLPPYSGLGVEFDEVIKMRVTGAGIKVERPLGGIIVAISAE